MSDTALWTQVGKTYFAFGKVREFAFINREVPNILGLDYSDEKEILESFGSGLSPVQIAPGVYMYAREGQAELELPPNYEKRWQLPRYNRPIELPPRPEAKPSQVSWALGVSIEPTEIPPLGIFVRK